MDYVFIITLLICGYSDFRTRIIPNKITIPLVVLCLSYQAYQGNITSSLVGLSMGFGIGALSFYAKGMGGGDVKLMAAIGAYLGVYSFISVLFVASVLSVVWGIAQFLKNKVSINRDEAINKIKSTIPFGTCLSISVVNIYFYPITF